MSARRRLAVVALLAALTMLLGFLFNRTRAVDLDAQNQVVLNLRELGKLDAEWNVNILRSHIGLNPDYDPLSEPLPRMRALQERLQAALPMAHSAAAVTAERQLGRALQDKEALVEQFKSANAILRNSLIYFPPAVTELKTELNGIEGAVAPTRNVLALDTALNALLTSVLRYNLAPDPELALRIGRTVDVVLAQKRAFSPAVGDTLEELAGHARAIVHYRSLENALEASINSTGSSEAIDRLGVLFDRAFDEVLLDRQRFRSYLFAYSGLLLLLLIFAARRLRRSYRIIGEVNQRLQAANETLELRVAERTAELEAQSEKLKQLAQHDSLTGLVNYGQLTRLLEHALVRAGRRGTTVALMFIDLDGFKAVNDTWGHGAGDLVLQEVARRVQDKLRKEDTLARLGGDEFVILLEEVTSRDGAMRVAQLALDQIRAIEQVGGHPVRISASIGISSAHGRAGAARGSAALLAEADQAMYRAKQAGKAAWRFSPEAQWGASPAVAASAPSR